VNEDFDYTDTQHRTTGRRMALLLGCAVLLFAVSAFVFASYSRARSRATSLAATHQLIPLGSHFSLYRIDTQQFAPAWEFQFDPPDMFITAPFRSALAARSSPLARRTSSRFSPPNDNAATSNQALERAPGFAVQLRGVGFGPSGSVTGCASAADSRKRASPSRGLGFPAPPAPSPCAGLLPCAAPGPPSLSLGIATHIPK